MREREGESGMSELMMKNMWVSEYEWVSKEIWDVERREDKSWGRRDKVKQTLHSLPLAQMADNFQILVTGMIMTYFQEKVIMSKCSTNKTS